MPASFFSSFFLSFKITERKKSRNINCLCQLKRFSFFLSASLEKCLLNEQNKTKQRQEREREGEKRFIFVIDIYFSFVVNTP
jgi:hypothetical protein